MPGNLITLDITFKSSRLTVKKHEHVSEYRVISVVERNTEMIRSVYSELRQILRCNPNDIKRISRLIR